MRAPVWLLCDVAAGREVRVDDGEWRALLLFTDRTLSTPLLRGAGPAWLQQEVELRIERIARKQVRLRETYTEASIALKRAGLEFVVLKGFTHPDSSPRAQNDIDLWVRDANAAERVLFAAGFVRHGRGELSVNHTAPLLKPHAWRWRGDYFDPEMPVPIELHYTLWNEQREKIAAPGVDAFWSRRVVENGVPALAQADRLGFAALHLLRHVLRNNVRPAQAWELAQWARNADDQLWETWRCDHATELRGLESIALFLAAAWFGRGMAPAVELPDSTRGWLEHHWQAPLQNLCEPNKAALWLQLALIPDRWDRLTVVLRRLLPLRVPRREEAADGSYARHVWGRLRYHALALARLGTSDSKFRDTSD